MSAIHAAVRLYDSASTSVSNVRSADTPTAIS